MDPEEMEIEELADEIDEEIDDDTDDDDEQEVGENEAESDEADEPEDLAAAFRRVQQMDREDPAEDVEAGSEGGEEEPESPDEPEPEPADDDEGGSGDDRGYAAVDRSGDYRATTEAIGRQLTNAAIQQAVSEFKEQGIREFRMNDIYERTQDGRVIYRNPDDPSRPFASRMEAQAWIDSFNGQLNQELKRRAVEIRKDLSKSVAPAVRLMEFAPQYDAMDDMTREFFDELVEGYEIENSDGDVVGYSCDLNKMAAKASKMAGRRQQAKPVRKSRTTEAAVTRQPSVDMASHGSGGNGKIKREPQTLEEAMMMLRKQRKEN